MKKIVIAVDGYSSCGKSTMARALADRIGYVYIDSGAMYRAITLLALRGGVFDEQNQIDQERLRQLLGQSTIAFRKQDGRTETMLNGESVEGSIRGMEVSSRVSAVAALPFVRQELVRQQQAMGRDKGIIMDGRDIGTTVFPDAEMKVFVTASAEVRARRRYDELQAKGEACDYDDILRNVQERDYIDSHREVSPLRQADDAVVLDNGRMTRQEQLQWLTDLYNQRVQEEA